MTLDLDRLREALERGYNDWVFGDPLSDLDLGALETIVDAARLLLGAEKRWECRQFDVVIVGSNIECAFDGGHFPDCGWRLSIPLPGVSE